MSEIEELKNDISNLEIKINEVVEPVISTVEENIKVEEEKKDINVEEVKVEEVKVEEINVEDVKTFFNLFSIFLTQDQKILTEKITKFNINLTPEIQKYFLQLCKESPELFGSFEETLKKILLDNRINSKDISDILVLVSKIHKVVKENKGLPIVDPYELIKTLILLGFIIYIETNNIENKEAILDLLRIIDASIDLIKLTPIIPKKRWLCFKC